jgi:hypothetical protein
MARLALLAFGVTGWMAAWRIYRALLVAADEKAADANHIVRAETELIELRGRLGEEGP